MKRIFVIIAGCFITCIGIIILHHAHLVTGGTAGLALSVSYLFDMSFSMAFIFVNLPFYILSIMRMGWNFTLSSIFAVTTVSLIAGLDSWMPNVVVPELVAAVVGGGFVGLGLSFLFCNGASLGGVNILVLYFQKAFGWDPGKITFVADSLVVLLGVSAVGLIKGGYSILSVMVLSSIISYYKGRIASRNMAQAAEPAD